MPQTVAAMQPLDGPLMRRYCALALQHKLWLSLGGFQETGPDSGHLFNCHVVISADGAIKARYRKVHLFNVEVQNGPVLMESRSTAPGNEVALCASEQSTLLLLWGLSASRNPVLGTLAGCSALEGRYAQDR